MYIRHGICKHGDGKGLFRKICECPNYHCAAFIKQTCDWATCWTTFNTDHLNNIVRDRYLSLFVLCPDCDAYLNNQIQKELRSQPVLDWRPNQAIPEDHYAF